MSERIQNVKPKEWNGIKFRSTLEAETAKVLKALNIPFAYELEKIVLQEGFRSPFQKEKVRALTYTPDFKIGNIMLECKGFETPEWKIKKKLVLKWLQDNAPDITFYQIHDARKSLLEMLDNHWATLGYQIQTISQVKKKSDIEHIRRFSSIAEAMEAFELTGRPVGAILKSLTHEKKYVYGHKWELIKI